MSKTEMNGDMLPSKVTPEALEARIVRETYEVMPNGRTVRCELVMENGWTEYGEGSAVSAANFNEAEGRKWARLQALNKLWPLEGYLLRERRFRAGVEA